jgi:hypothetical protein
MIVTTSATTTEQQQQPFSSNGERDMLLFFSFVLLLCVFQVRATMMLCFSNSTKMVAAIPLLAAVLCFVGFCCFRNLRHERIHYWLNLGLARADFVLANLQMIPLEDPDRTLRDYMQIKAWNKLWFHKIEHETALLGTRWRALPGASRCA